MILTRLQKTLEKLLDLDAAPDIQSFLLTRRVSEHLAGGVHQYFVQETLYIVGNAFEDLELGVFVDDAIVRHLTTHCPYRRLGAHNFEAFLLALEGVSHFVMLHFCARYSQPVRLLDLERQADLDKWIVTYLLLRAQQAKTHPRLTSALTLRLFRQIEVDARLHTKEQERYWMATQQAECKIKALLDCYPSVVPLCEVVRAARRYLRRAA